MTDEDDAPIRPSSLTAPDLHEFATDSMPDHLVRNVNHPTQVVDRLLKDHKPAVLLLSGKYETSSMYYSLAYQHRQRFVFGESRAKNLHMAKEFGVKKYPTLLVLVPKAMAEEPYNEDYGLLRYNKGELKKENITQRLEGVAKKGRSGRHSEF